MLKALDVEAQHGRQAVHRHLLDGVLRAAAAAADPVLGRAQALRAHKALQAAQQTDRPGQLGQLPPGPLPLLLLGCNPCSAPDLPFMQV